MGVAVGVLVGVAVGVLVGVAVGVFVGVAVGVLVGVGVPPPATIVKFTSLISKKILPTASTLILAVVVGRFGTLIDSDPSFAVEARTVVGNVCPPSVESEILTFAVSIPPPVVPLTSHVTV